MYSVDADTKDAHWASGAVPASDWSRSLLSEPAGPLDDAFPWSGRFRAVARSGAGRRPAGPRRHGAQGRHPRRYPRADAPDLLPPRRLDARAVGRRRQRNRSSARPSAAGTSRPTDPRAKWAFGFRFHGAPEDGVEVRLELDQHGDGVTVRVADSTHDLGVVPGFAPPPQGSSARHTRGGGDPGAQTLTSTSGHCSSRTAWHRAGRRPHALRSANR